MIGQPVPKPRRDWKHSSRQRMSEAEPERLFREGRCFRCKEIGHLASECSVSVRHPNVNRAPVKQGARPLAELGVLQSQTQEPEHRHDLMITKVRDWQLHRILFDRLKCDS